MGEATIVVSFPNDSDQAFRKAILKASAKLYGSNTDMAPADLLSVQITLMVDVLWNSFRGIVLDPSPTALKAFLTSAAEVVTTGQHLVDAPAKATTPGTDAARKVAMGEAPQTKEALLNIISMAAEHMEFLAKMLRTSRTIRAVGEKKFTATWKAAAEEAEIGAAKIREMAGLPAKAAHPRTSDPTAPADASGRGS